MSFVTSATIIQYHARIRIIGAVAACSIPHAMSAATKENFLSNALYSFPGSILRSSVLVNNQYYPFDPLSSKNSTPVSGSPPLLFMTQNKTVQRRDTRDWVSATAFLQFRFPLVPSQFEDRYFIVYTLISLGTSGSWLCSGSEVNRE